MCLGGPANAALRQRTGLFVSIQMCNALLSRPGCSDHLELGSQNEAMCLEHVTHKNVKLDLI